VLLGVAVSVGRMVCMQIFHLEGWKVIENALFESWETLEFGVFWPWKVLENTAECPYESCNKRITNRCTDMIQDKLLS